MRSIVTGKPFLAAFFAAALILAPSAALAQKVRVGYWTSGVSLGFGALLESERFLQKEGLEVEWVKFGEVNGPLRAMPSHAIDIAFGAPSAGSMAVAADGIPIKIFLNSQIAEVHFVVLADSPIKTLADIRGKKLGMSPAGSATHSLGVALLEHNLGIKPNEYTTVPGNEGRLAQFLAQREIDVGALRSTTIAQMNEVKLRRLGSYVEEWKKLTKSNTPPILAVSIVHDDFLAKHPEAVAKFIVATRKAVQFGSANKARVAAVLQQAANMPADDAQAYAAQWDQIYIASFDANDVAALKRQAEIFKAAGTLKKDVPDSAFATAPYQRALGMK